MTDISVLLTTRNRATALRETLEAMGRLDRSGLAVEFVVVDNGSTDDTGRVLAEFAERLPLSWSTDPVPGKSHAMNHAFVRFELGRIVVFTDDDITPDASWLQVIADACRRWPAHAVFGGTIEPEWPVGRTSPTWADHEVIQSLAFARHKPAEVEGEYGPGKNPFGGNYWVRREAAVGARFQEKIGPHPGRPGPGDETQFIEQLRRKGLPPVYIPEASVRHRIEADGLSKEAVYRRALHGGLAVVYVHGLPEKASFQRSRFIWRLGRLRTIAKIVLEFPLVLLSRDENWRVLNVTYLIWSIAEHLQALRLSLMADESLMQWISQHPEGSAPS